ncbi:putative aminophospholipid-translocase [Ascosphaera pollenicola]|nr:putative aminophospholipid-translocase [Ascosphaera pollenicola]
MWRDGDAMLEAVFRVARQAWKHELLIENFAGMPVLQQHGSADDNVPVYHSRLMHQLAGSTTYHELSGEPHWRDGVLETSHLLEFYRQHASKPTHELPSEFSLIVRAAGSIGPRGGIAVEQLTSPHRAGRIDVSRRGGDGLGSSWVLKTQNIRSFHIRRSAAAAAAGLFPKEVQIDGHKYDLHTSSTTYFVKNRKSWTVTDGAQGIFSIAQRSGRQVGSLDAILRSNGRFSIVCAKRTMALAVQISRNFLQYYGADSQIVGLDKCSDAIGSTTGNIITVVEGRDYPPAYPYTGSRSPTSEFPVRITDEAIIVEGKDEEDEDSAIYGIQPGRFVVTLRPLPDQRLELLLWGADGEAVRYASRLVPMVTGTGQPDFIVGDAGELRVRGAGGVLAAGFFDWQWKVARGSYVTQ